MVSMKMSPAERSAPGSPTSILDAPSYPYGLAISLDNGTLKKLGIKDLPEVGEELMLMATVKVTSVSSSEGEGGSQKNVSLQITEACLGEDAEMQGAESKLYDKKD
jgi:hypothetical protein